VPGDQMYFSLPPDTPDGPQYRARLRQLVGSRHRGVRSLSGLISVIVTDYIDVLDAPLPALPEKWSAPLTPPAPARQGRQVKPSTPIEPPPVTFTPPNTAGAATE
jgi:hypothetical protein